MLVVCRHQVVELCGRAGHALASEPKCIHVWKLKLAVHLQWFQVKITNVKALIGLHHCLRNQTVEPACVHVGIQDEAGLRNINQKCAW